MSFLTLEHVSHHYFSKNGFTKALDNISFSVKEGEFISLLGPSGCGKSTILSIIAGIMKQTAGDVFLQHKSISNNDLSIGYMLQQDYLFPWKTIIDNILLGPKIQNQHTEETRSRALELLEVVGLANVAEKYPSALSGGMRQRVALVRTLINDPKLLLLDEPFSALDYQTKLKLENLVAKLFKTYHKTAILVTHDIGEAIAMSDRVFIMNANPGSIARVFEVPIELRNETPILVRKHQKYQLLFDKIWEELDKKESASKVVL
ncbi:spermidine/putrescine ABC transporter ATP-binding protein [Oceanobacillus zhaokaii]|uniref:Spermidine/putrescine ABC transporter ATP-binding protein n=1 Tax=Oceanobacillus zhaokaii TaxID=2052660 RepID=A0A345PIJ7_9BACI|nr:ABC transporter ATP-binding protein [Oceanobacillus zhaokaii]AXI09827.1 spermidine/putrescine ABC transporter ATP-binding protein [Oceanobacillus zhaokaii]